MTDELMLIFGDDGIAREYKDDFDITIHCESKEEQDEVWKRLAQDDWIPCSERLPNCNGCYLVWRPHFWGGKKGMPAICYFDGQNTWHDSYGVDFERVLHSDDVTAWKQLPKPYRGEQDV